VIPKILFVSVFLMVSLPPRVFAQNANNFVVYDNSYVIPSLALPAVPELGQEIILPSNKYPLAEIEIEGICPAEFAGKVSVKIYAPPDPSTAGTPGALLYNSGELQISGGGFLFSSGTFSGYFPEHFIVSMAFLGAAAGHGQLIAAQDPTVGESVALWKKSTTWERIPRGAAGFNNFRFRLQAFAKVLLQSPATGVLPAGSPVTFTVSIPSFVATKRVEYFAGGLKLGESSNAPFQFVWENTPTGFYRLFARSYDDFSTNDSPLVKVAILPPDTGALAIYPNSLNRLQIDLAAAPNAKIMVQGTQDFKTWDSGVSLSVPSPGITNVFTYPTNSFQFFRIIKAE